MTQYVAFVQVWEHITTYLPFIYLFLSATAFQLAYRGVEGCYIIIKHDASETVKTMSS